MGSFYGGGGISSGGSPDATKTLFKTVQQWNATPGLVSEANTFYVYTDYKVTDEGKTIPGMKIGNGVNYLIDLPFIAAGEESMTQIYDHINNTAVHMTNQDRERLETSLEAVQTALEDVNEAVEKVDQKVTVAESSDDPENIVFSW